ncbi:MAG: serine/threonine protein phosphatase [Verrucomicrobiaceae bacterium]|jgi:serine/threonine protein phosphatase 1|nr:serine/threonine protein phosphatase [Verrucomicrobiaceae bacterium]
MRTLVIGDIHGCSTALDALLERLAPGPDDTLVTLGDYVDRGPDSRGVIERLLQLEKSTQLVPILGNHEILMIDACEHQIDFEAWCAIGGRTTMESYAGAVRPDWGSVPAAHWEFIEKRCRRWFESDTHIFAHAGVNAALPLADQGDDWLFWRRFDDVHAHFSGKTVICGHTAQKSGIPGIKPGIICIDTWAYGEGWLTGFDTAAQIFIQTSQRGELRTLSLAEVLAAQPARD